MNARKIMPTGYMMDDDGLRQWQQHRKTCRDSGKDMKRPTRMQGLGNENGNWFIQV